MKLNKIFLFLVLSVVSFSGNLFAQGDMFITNATILTGTGEKIENGSIIVRDGKIAEIGQNLTAPSGVRVVDAKGQWAMPGIIDHHSHMAMQTSNELTLPNTAMTDVTDQIVNDDRALYNALAGGVTTIHQLHGSGNPIGGRDEILKLKWGKTREEMIVPDKMEGVKFALGENPLRVHNGGNNRLNNNRSRMWVEKKLREYFTMGQEYKRSWEEYELKKSGKIKPDNDYEKKFGPIPPRKDITMEAMVGMLNGDIRIHTHSYSNQEIAMLLRLAKEFNVQIASVEHAHEAYMLADELLESGAIASLYGDSWNYKVEASMGTAFSASLLTEKGVKVAYHSDSPEKVRRLQLEAAKTVRYGTNSEEDAIKMVTANPSYGLRLNDRIGSLEVGKDADIALYDGNPLSVFSKCVKTIIEGEVYFDRENAITTDKWLKGITKKKKTTEGER